MVCATTAFYTLSLHDALPICSVRCGLRASASCVATSSIGRRGLLRRHELRAQRDRKSTRLNSSHTVISYAVFCLKKKKNKQIHCTTPTTHKSTRPPSHQTCT